jgi:hypothetical protein
MIQRLTENWVVDWSLVTGKGNTMPLYRSASAGQPQGARSPARDIPMSLAVTSHLGGGIIWLSSSARPARIDKDRPDYPLMRRVGC